MENPIKMDDLGGKPTIFGKIQIVIRGAFADITQSSGAVAQWVDSLLRFLAVSPDLLVDTRDPETHIFAPRKWMVGR